MSDSELSSPDTLVKKLRRKIAAHCHADLAKCFPRPRPIPRPPVPLTPLDLWLRAALEDNGKRLTVPASMPPICEQNGGLNYIDCVFTLVQIPGEVDDPFVDPDRFYLKLHLVIPPSSGFLVFFQTSPTITLATHENFLWGPDLALWTEYIKPGDFVRQPHMSAVNILSYFAQATPLNSETVCRKVDEWCAVVSDIRPCSLNPMTVFFQDRGGQTLSPKNTCSHKPRAWDLDAKEANQLRAPESPSKSSGAMTCLA